jgi:uncharacterized membrane protein YhaH (DUF805 family)
MAQAIAAGVVVVAVAAGAHLMGSGGSTFIVLAILAIAAFVPLLVSSFAVGTKRLHDRNKSGCWLLIYSGGAAFVFLLGAMILDLTEINGIERQVHWVDTFLIIVIMAGAVFELGFMPGTSGSNAYGSDPAKARSSHRLRSRQSGRIDRSDVRPDKAAA